MTDAQVISLAERIFIELLGKNKAIGDEDIILLTRFSLKSATWFYEIWEKQCNQNKNS